MKRTAIIASATASLLMAGCNNEPEEAPDITEAIPLDEIETVNAVEADGNNIEPVSESGAADDIPIPGASWSGDPDTVERGDNSGQPPIDLENSKLQPAG